MIATKQLGSGPGRSVVRTLVLAATLLGAGTLLSACPEITIDPSSGPQGAEQMVIRVDGVETGFSESGTTVSFSGPNGPSGIIVQYPLDIRSRTLMFVTISIPQGEDIGTHTMTVNSGLYDADAPFDVGPLPSIGPDPIELEQGDDPLVVTIVGSNTDFLDASCIGDPSVSITGVQAANWTPITATTATVEFTVGLGVPVDDYDGAFQIQCEYQTLSADVRITAAQRNITLTPDFLRQGTSGPILIEANKAEFTQYFDVAIYPPEGIDISWATPTDDKIANVTVSVHSYAEYGPRTFVVTDPYGTIETLFTVTEDLTPPSVSYHPNILRPGDVLTIAAQGINTSFDLLLTNLTQDPPSGGLRLTISDVSPPDLAELSAEVDLLAEEQEYTVTLVTELEHVENTIWVVPEPSMTLDATQGHQDQSYAIHVLGTNTHFHQQSSVVSAKPGSGITVSNWQAPESDEASFVLHIAANADPILVDEAISIVTDVYGQWTETLTANFRVLPGIPEADLFPPSVEQNSQGVAVQALGQFTNWIDGATTATVDATCQVYLTVHPAVVANPTDLTFHVDVHLVAPAMTCGITFVTDSGSLHEEVRAHLQILSTATVINRPITQTINGFVNGPQIYSIYLLAGEILRARASCDPILYLDPTLEIHAPGGNHLPGPVAQNEDEHAATEDALVVYQAPDDGTYYLVVQDRLGFEVGDFTLSLSEYHVVDPADPMDSGTNYTRNDAHPMSGPVVRGGIDYTLNPRWYTINATALPSASRTAVQIIARSVSPFETSGADVLLQLYNSTTLLDASNIGTETPDPVLYVDTADLTHISLENDASGLSSTTYWLNLRPWLVINEIYHDEVNDWEASFVELYGEPGVQMLGCNLIGLVHDGTQESEAFNISLDGSTILESGYYVVAHDDLVPGVGQPHINADLQILNGPYASVGVFLECNGTTIDRFCWRSAQLTGCIEGTVPDATTIGNSLGRGFHVDTNDNLQDFLPQPEPSPWNRNLREVW